MPALPNQCLQFERAVIEIEEAFEVSMTNIYEQTVIVLSRQSLSKNFDGTKLGCIKTGYTFPLRAQRSNHFEVGDKSHAKLFIR